MYLLLDNKSPYPWEQGGKTPRWKKKRYANVQFKRLIDITMGKKRSVNPMVCKDVTWKDKVLELISDGCIKVVAR